MNDAALTHEATEPRTRHPNLASKGIFTRTVGGITVHAVRCGWIKYRNAHVHSKLGPYLVLLDPTWIDWAPVFTWVIEHPEGILLIDTGLTEKALGPDLMKGGMMGWLNRNLAKANISEDWDIRAQLNRLDLSPADVRWVALTHLHLDHAAGIQYFPDSEFLVPHAEYVRPYGAVENGYPDWFKPTLVTHNDEIGGVFETGHVLTKAGDVILVSTPGHTYNHQSVILKTREMSLLFAGDAAFTFEHVQSGFVPGINVDRGCAKLTLQKIKSFCLETPAYCLTSHDQKSVNNLFLRND